jgi:hypothetical protein
MISFLPRLIGIVLIVTSVIVALSAPVFAQGVTTAAIQGLVVDQNGNALPGANVIALHVSSGTTYGASTRGDGRFTIPGMRVGGPYRVTVSYVGYETRTEDNVFLNLGVATNLEFSLRDVDIALSEVVVTGRRDAIFSSDRTGATTSVDRQTIETVPTITRRINDIVRLTPQAVPRFTGFSIAGQDNRLNNITVDGSYFNNSFGLQSNPGDRTNVAPISMDAIEQVQISIAPFDVRQGHFVGGGVNTVTRSGTNIFSGSLYYQTRNEGLVGTKAKELEFDPGEFKYNHIGVRLGGPIIQNKLFFFTSFEDDGLTEPGTTFLARTSPTQQPGGNITRVLASDLDNLSNYLRQNFQYETGPYQGYDHETPATRFLLKLDYNLDQRNKLSFRYIYLDSFTDVLASNSSSLGFGNRRTSTSALNFRNSNYQIMENIRSFVGEWNSVLSNNMSNNLILGFSSHDESRDTRGGSFFPMVDILQDGSTYTTFGFEPFTPNNELRYWVFQLQNNFTMYIPNHTLTFGLSFERYESENVFFPGSQSVYVYNSLDDFYTDANDYIANPNRTSSPVNLRRFQVRWMNIPGMEKPVQPLEVYYTGLFAQDEWQVNRDLTLTLGLRLDVPFFGATGFRNPEADGLTFRDEDGNPVKYQSDKLPDPNIQFSPRIGFNWNVTGDRQTQLRGGTGIFSGPPIYVWISNQIGNTGVLTGFERLDNVPAGTTIANGGRPFHPDPNFYKPSTVTGDPASSYELALTDPNFKFPQLWRSNLAVDQRLPFDLVGTLEFIYSRDINGIYYINANQAPANAQFSGVDNRPRWTSTAARRIHQHIDNAIVLKNQNVGYAWNIAASLELPYRNGLFAKAAYSYGLSKNTIDPGSIAFGSWNNNQHSGDPNNPGAAFATGSPGHRVFAAVSYRKEYFKFGATTISLFWDGYNQGLTSYVFAGDLNGDGGTSNDLIYIHGNVSEMNFREYSSGGVTFTTAQQAAAWDAFIEQDPYLSKNRGKYAERNGVLLPMVFRTDFSITQEVFTNIMNNRNSLQFRVDFLNFGNLLNKDWGVGQRLVTTQPLISRGADAEGRATYELRNIGGQLISESYQQTLNVDDVFRIQFTVRYTFN